MEAMLKAIISLPIFSLLLMPAYYVGAKLVRAKKLSFGATFLLILITSVVVQICALVIPEVPSTNTPLLDLAIPFFIYALIAGCVFGYLVRTSSDRSIGVGKGMVLSFVFCTVGALILPILSLIAIGVMSVFP